MSLDSGDGVDATVEPHHDELSPRLARLGELRAAWSALAPAGPVEDAEEIGATGRALTDHLSNLVDSRSDVSSAALTGIDNLLSEFETSIRHVATAIPVAQLRSTLPAQAETDRRGLLQLLDVLVGQGFGDPGAVIDRIGMIDYLVTLLCTQGAATGSVRFDPVSLTDRLAALCAEHDDPDDPRIAEIETEFFAAANLDAESLREELQQRTLRQRKAELGPLYFSPRILRAIVTYNAALIARVQDELLDSADWGELSTESAATAGGAGSASISAFENEALQLLATAIRRRVAGEDAAPVPIDRVAWALDFEFLEDHERQSLANEDLATPSDPLGTAILIGLLCRSATVLSIDLQDADLCPDDITGPWVEELRLLFQDEINRHISEDAYKLACALSELKNRFLFEPLAEPLEALPVPPVGAPETRVEPDPDETERAEAKAVTQPHAKPARESRRESARDLVREALEEARSDGREAKRGLRLDLVPWKRLAQGTAIAAALVAGVLTLWNREPDLDRLDQDQLTAVSPYLAEGKRDGVGTGRSFIGEIDEAWLSLPPADREAIAEGIVERLRERGMQQVMIYDDERRVRIQALGSQPTRVL